MSELGYNANPEQDAAGHKGGFEIIEPGWKKVVITASEVKDTSSGKGKMLVFTYELQDGTGRTVIDRLNIVNLSEVAQKIGRGALGKIAVAIGHKDTLSRTEPLHGRPFEAKLTVEDFESNKPEDKDPVTGKGKMLKSNKVTDYRAVTVAAPVLAADKTPAAW